MNKFLAVLILFLSCGLCSAEIMQDDIASCLPKDTPMPEAYLDYDFESAVKIPVGLKVLEPIKSETEIYEGQVVRFKVNKNVYHNGRVVIRRGSPVTARIAIIIPPGMNGIPASIIFRDFKIEGVECGQLTESYEVFGQDRSLWVFPLKWALTPLPPTGSLTNFIMGGHAGMKEKKLVTIYYYPEWK